MKRILFFITIVCFVFASNLYAANKYGCTGLTGGTAGTLDALDITGATTPNVDDLAEGDVAEVNVISGTTVTKYNYIYDASGTDAESSPSVIRPDDYATAGVWRLSALYTSGTDIPPTAFGPGYSVWFEDTDNGLNYVGWGSPASNNNDLILLPPVSDPTAGQIMAFGVPSSVTFSDNAAKDASQATWVSQTDIKKVETTGSFATPTTTNPYAISASLCYNGTLFYGATGEVDLPALVDGMALIIYNTGAFTITIDPNGSEAITRDGTAQTGGVSITLDSGAGNFVALVSDGTQWITLGYKGTLAEGT